MRTDRLPHRAPLLLALAVGVVWPIAGCGDDVKTAQVSPEVQKKTTDMLNNMQKEMQTKYKSKAARGGR